MHYYHYCYYLLRLRGSAQRGPGTGQQRTNVVPFLLQGTAPRIQLCEQTARVCVLSLCNGKRGGGALQRAAARVELSRTVRSPALGPVTCAVCD